MTVVLDASVVVELVLGTGTGASIRGRLSDPMISLHSPELVDLEVLNVLRRYVTAGAVSPDRAVVALDRLNELDLRRHRHGPMRERIWAWRANLSAYDAAYVALAETIDAPLLTTDGRMGRAPGLAIPVEVFAAETRH